jgi:hypothetical protein
MCQVFSAESEQIRVFNTFADKLFDFMLDLLDSFFNYYTSIIAKWEYLVNPNVNLRKHGPDPVVL